MGWRRRSRDRDPRQTRARLIDRKHALEGEIRQLQGEIRRRRDRGDDVSGLEASVSTAQAEHYRLRMQIDRTR